MSKKNKLLVVEDETDLLNALTEELKPLHFEVVTAKTGNEAFEKIKDDQQIIAVLSDIVMPGMSGIDCLKKIRDLGNEIPFVFLTGNGNKESLTEALRFGATDFLDKPCSPEVLVTTVRHALRIGMFIRALDAEIENMVTKYRISAADHDRLRTFQRAALTGRVIGGI
jgi:two-component system repressor protein LuxO